MAGGHRAHGVQAEHTRAVCHLGPITNVHRDLAKGSDAVAALEMIIGAYQAQLTESRVSFPM